MDANPVRLFDGFRLRRIRWFILNKDTRTTGTQHTRLASLVGWVPRTIERF